MTSLNTCTGSIQNPGILANATANLAPIHTWDEAVIMVRSGDLNAVHRRVWRTITNGVPSDRRRDFLYAPLMESSDNRMAVLVRSAHLSIDGAAVHRRGTPLNGQSSDFRLLLRLEHKSKQTRRTTLYEESEAVEWLSDRLQENGLSLEGTPDMIRSGNTMIRSGWHTDMPYWEVYGSLTVRDRDRAGDLLLNGLGRCKGFGFGLLMFAAAKAH